MYEAKSSITKNRYLGFIVQLKSKSSSEYWINISRSDYISYYRGCIYDEYRQFFRVIPISSNFGSLVSYRRILAVNFLSSRSIISKWKRRDGVRRTPSMSLWFQDSPESDFLPKNPFTSIQFNRSSSISSSGFNCSFFIDCESQNHYSSYCIDYAYTFLIWVQSRDNSNLPQMSYAVSRLFRVQCHHLNMWQVGSKTTHPWYSAVMEGQVAQSPSLSDQSRYLGYLAKSGHRAATSEDQGKDIVTFFEG